MRYDSKQGKNSKREFTKLKKHLFEQQGIPNTKQQRDDTTTHLQSLREVEVQLKPGG